jgi:hypothetical protein
MDLIDEQWKVLEPLIGEMPGKTVARFFVSLFPCGRTAALRTYPTLYAAPVALTAVRASPPDTGPAGDT